MAKLKVTIIVIGCSVILIIFIAISSFSYVVEIGYELDPAEEFVIYYKTSYWNYIHSRFNPRLPGDAGGGRYRGRPFIAILKTYSGDTLAIKYYKSFDCIKSADWHNDKVFLYCSGDGVDYFDLK